jgi:hypothetical protein
MRECCYYLIMDTKRTILILVFSLALISTGCFSLLPSTKTKIQSQWQSFDAAKTSFDKVTPYQTTEADLKTLGFDPYTSPNIKILTYLDVMNRFMPNPSIKKEELDEGIQYCIDSREYCKALEFQPSHVNTQRQGNVVLDVLNFQRKVEQTGWEFQAFIVLIDDVVVYKLWGGKPAIDEYREAKNPLGPLQDAGAGMAKDAAVKAVIP